MEIKATLQAPYTEDEKVNFIIEQNHNKGYEIRGEQPETLTAWGYTNSEILEAARQSKYKENEVIRDAYLVSGVTYKNVLFDSDIEQKLNIKVTTDEMSETDTIDWLGKDGVTKLNCTKEDLLNIGALLTTMTSYVWQYRNPELKIAIQNASSIEELNNIEITYEPIQQN